MQTPLLSICIPTYNRAEYLEKSLDSLVNQENFSQIEVVISDNASTDATSDVCRKFTERYPNIFYYRNEENIHDRNFPVVLMKAHGKFRKLYNDNMIHLPESIAYLKSVVESFLSERPFLFFLHGKTGVKSQDEDIYECKNLDDLILSTSHHFTWLSGFGFWEDDCKNLESEFSLCDTKIWQTHKGLKTAASRKKSFIITKKMIELQRIQKRDFSYGLYTVFFQNFPALLFQYERTGLLSEKAIAKVRKHMLFTLAGGWIGNAQENKTAYFGFQRDFMKLIYEDYRKELYYPAFRAWRFLTSAKKKVVIGIRDRIKTSLIGGNLIKLKRKLNLRFY